MVVNLDTVKDKLEYLEGLGCTVRQKKNAKGNYTNLYMCTFQKVVVADGLTLDRIIEMVKE